MFCNPLFRLLSTVVWTTAMRYSPEQRMDRLGDSRLSRMLQLALLGARRRDSISPILCSLHWLPVRRRVIFKSAVIAWKCVNGVRRSDIFTRALCPNRGRPWSPATAVCVNSLHFTASGSDLHWTAQLRVQRSCSVEQQSAPSLARKHVTGYI